MNYSAGIDIGGTLVKLALVSAEGDILAEQRMPTPVETTPQDLLFQSRRKLEALSEECGLVYPPVGGCGIGIPGIVHHQSGDLKFSGPLGWNDIPFGTLARDILGCPVVIDTDVNAGALADLYFGAAKDASDMLYISWGTGIGAALAVNRKLYHSRGGAMCNLGHMPAKLSSKRLCYCGTTGCLEIEAGGKAIVEKTTELMRKSGHCIELQEKLTPEKIVIAAAQGDTAAQTVLEEAATLLARVLAAVLALLNPDTVVFGGGVSKALPAIRSSFDEELHRRAPQFSLPLTQIMYSTFGDSAGVVGAAALTKFGLSEWICH